jgi:hypothetical protein
MQFEELKTLVKTNKIYIQSTIRKNLSFIELTDKKKIEFQSHLCYGNGETSSQLNLLYKPSKDISTMVKASGIHSKLESKPIQIEFNDNTFEVVLHFLECEVSDATLTIHENDTASGPYLRVIKIEKRYMGWKWEECSWSACIENYWRHVNKWKMTAKK